MSFFDYQLGIFKWRPTRRLGRSRQVVATAIVLLSLGAGDAVSKDNKPNPRIHEIESRFVAVSEWNLVHDIDSLSANTKRLLDKFAGSEVGQLGDTMGTGEVQIGGVSSIFLYAAISESFVIIANYRNHGIAGVWIEVFVVDRRQGDGCTYMFDPRRELVPSIKRLQSEASMGLQQESSCRYRQRSV